LEFLFPLFSLRDIARPHYLNKSVSLPYLWVRFKSFFWLPVGKKVTVFIGFLLFFLFLPFWKGKGFFYSYSVKKPYRADDRAF
jgi:hypothetical protein